MVIKEEGVNPRLVSSAVMAQALEQIGENPKGAIPIKIRRLTYWMREAICGSASKDDFEAWVAKNPTHPNVAVCDPGCGGISLIDKFDICPFCGDGAMNTESAAEKKTSIPTLEVLTTEDLDTSVQKINDLKGEMATNYYTLGVLLRDVEEKCLWALRKKKDGQGKYKDFSAWARHEVKLGRTQAMKCISVAENFSEDDVRKIGHTKLAIALQVPAAERPKLLEAAENGASKRDLEAAVNEIKGNVTVDKVTVVLAPTETVLPMYRRPASPDEKLLPAYNPDDEPFAVETLGNGVIQSYHISRNDNLEMILTIRRHRETT